MAIIQTVVCDACSEVIEDKLPYIEAKNYGADFHPECFAKLSPFKLLKILDMCDITYDGLGSIWNLAQLDLVQLDKHRTRNDFAEG